MANQSDIWENTRVDGPIEALNRVRDQLGGRTSTSRWLSEEIAARFDRAPYWPDLDLKFGVLGILLLGGWAMMYGPKSPHALALIIVAGEAGLIVLFMQVDFNRYHLPILLTLAIGVGFFAGQVWNAIAAAGRTYEGWRTRGRRHPRPTHLALPSGQSRPSESGQGSVSFPANTAYVSGPNRHTISPVGPILATVLSVGLFLGRAWLRLRTITRPNTRL